MAKPLLFSCRVFGHMLYLYFEEENIFFYLKGMHKIIFLIKILNKSIFKIQIPKVKFNSWGSNLFFFYLLYLNTILKAIVNQKRKNIFYLKGMHKIIFLIKILNKSIFKIKIPKIKFNSWGSNLFFFYLLYLNTILKAIVNQKRKNIILKQWAHLWLQIKGKTYPISRTMDKFPI